MPSEQWWVDHPKQARRRCETMVPGLFAVDPERRCRNWVGCKAHLRRGTHRGQRHRLLAGWFCEQPGCGAGSLALSDPASTLQDAQDHAARTAHFVRVNLAPDTYDPPTPGATP